MKSVIGNVPRHGSNKADSDRLNGSNRACLKRFRGFHRIRTRQIRTGGGILFFGVPIKTLVT